jgi:hypothetical protein
MRVAGAAVVVDHHAAARADGQHALAGQLVARPDAGGEHDQVGLEVAAVLEHHAVAVLGAVGDLGGAAPGVHVHAQGLDLLAQDAAAALVHLHRHQARGELHHMGFQAQVAQGLGAFQAQQAAAHHHAAPGLGAGGLHGLQVVDGAVDEAVRPLAAGDGRHEGHRAGGQHQHVVGQHLAIGGGHGAHPAVHAGGPGRQAQVEAGALEEAGLDQGQVLGGLAGEELGEVDPVVGRAGFLAQDGDLRVGQAGLGQALQELVAHHAVAGDDDFHGLLRREAAHVQRAHIRRGTRREPVPTENRRR